MILLECKHVDFILNPLSFIDNSFPIRALASFETKATTSVLNSLWGFKYFYEVLTNVIEIENCKTKY